jgi:Tfp pilus assembly protein PilX
VQPIAQEWYLGMSRESPTLLRSSSNILAQSIEGGWFLISAIVMIIFLSAIGLTIAGLVAVQFQHTRLESYDQNAQLVAEAGIEQSVTQLNSNNSFAGYSTPQTFFDNSTQGKGTYTTTVTTNSDGKSKTIVSIGNIYLNDSAPTPYQTRGVKVTVVGTTSSGYSVSTGPGGLILSGSASVTNSNVYVDGTISLSGHASIGTQANPVTVDAANMACPTGSNPGPTYPSLCTSSQPISISGSSAIWGTVCATGQTSSTGIQGGNGGAGLQVGCTAPTVSQPYYNRSGIISAIPGSNEFSGTSGSYACKGNSSITLPANSELTGSTVSWGNSCSIDINGNVYIPGNLSIGGASKITVDNATGTTRPVVVVDGTISVGGSASLIANSSGAGIDFVSFDNSTGDSSATPTGSNLYSSQQLQTINVGGAASSPGMVFDAYWSEVTLSGSGRVGAAAGQTVNLNGAGTVIFGTTLSSGSETWSITSYQLLY